VRTDVGFKVTVIVGTRVPVTKTVSLPPLVACVESPL
jgi:hypothetical protein